MQFSRIDIAAVALFSAALPWGTVASNQQAAYPQRPVTLVIGFPAGGSADALARLIGRYMGEDPVQPNTSSTFKELVAAETERWNGVLQIRNIQPLQ